jgi:uncharacterized protein
MDQRISIITLGVDDIARSRAFYETLGWQASPQSNDDVTFFQAGGLIFGLYGRASLADDAKVENTPAGFRGVSLAYNGRDRAEVDAVLAEAVDAGAKLIKAAEGVFWGATPVTSLTLIAICGKSPTIRFGPSRKMGRSYLINLNDYAAVTLY